MLQQTASKTHTNLAAVQLVDSRLFGRFYRPPGRALTARIRLIDVKKGWLGNLFR
jgi:hypothetical protein